MKISVMTSFYNGDMMIPYFMSHYAYADEIIIYFNDHGKLIDEATEKLILGYPNARIEPFDYPQNKTDYAFAVGVLNRAAAKLECDWGISVSGDELVFPVGMQDVRTVLRDADGAVINACFWNVFRHRGDKDLDPTLPAIWQRRHGWPDRSGVGCIKPTIFRPDAGISFGTGRHACSSKSNGGTSSIRFDGAHWLSADPVLSIQRRMRGRREHMSANTLTAGWGSQFFNITEREIRKQCASLLDGPQLF
jgi:hypothetical protein